ncbi:transport protein [Methanosarcina barkeri str. Wiesmoor]|uniref:Transport protein n=2 Tax=Methanosarcina barkeri TaxID=2208 RepID=A0A0E3QL26_METBA|nr:AI-2E family transporter [Methanosarcina barkeri]AKB50922.1 transport protein [Methanosarcina barkeri str. Wiesmoor]
MDMENQSIPARILLYSTAAVILTIGMREIAPILTVFFFSVFIALIFTPLVRWLKKKGIPGGLSVFLAILLFAFIVLILGVIVASAAIQFGSQIPQYQDQLTDFMSNLAKYIPSYDGFSVQSIIRGIVSITVSFVVNIFNGLVNTGTTAGIIILTTAFMLIEATNVPEKINEKIEKQSELQLRLSIFSRKLVKFIVIRAEINLITAVAITITFLISGIDYAILWGVLIFILSYIPYIGLVIASIPPIVIALFKYGPLGALAVIVVIAAVDGITENVLFPSLMGKGLQLSPAFLFLALIYWNFVLGGAGALLSIPLTMALKIMFESFDETKWMARLMGPPGEIE